jgi:GAF domain-containing protein
MSDVNKTVVSELAELVASLDHEGTETRTGLRELIDNGVRHVAGSHYAGIGLAGPDKVVTNVVATHRYPMVLDAIQDEYKEGPCLEAAWQHHIMHVVDLNVDQRWPRYQQYALAETPIRSIVSYELFVDSGAMGALNFYSHNPHAFSDDSMELGGVFANQVALA